MESTAAYYKSPQDTVCPHPAQPFESFSQQPGATVFRQSFFPAPWKPHHDYGRRQETNCIYPNRRPCRVSKEPSSERRPCKALSQGLSSKQPTVSDVELGGGHQPGYKGKTSGIKEGLTYANE